MDNPWLHIPLADYERHMAAPQVGQAQLLADLLAAALDQHKPASVAILGCAGGNGFERIAPERTPRVIGVDLNPEYIAQARARFAGRFPQLELLAADIEREPLPFAPVDLAFAGLLFEYVDAGCVLRRIRDMLTPGGTLVSIVQLPSPVAEVTPTPFKSLQQLAPVMRLIAPATLEQAAATVGLHQVSARTADAAGGKQFAVQTFDVAPRIQRTMPAQKEPPMDFHNCYADDAYADAYARLEFPGTYYLAFRDLPALFGRNVRGRQALDFGCGTGRSTRFLARHGFDAVGVDIAAEMVQRARTLDPAGDYRLVADGDLSQFAAGQFDLVLSAFTFDNVPTREHKMALLAALRRVLRPEGRLVNLVSSPEIYWHEWASFSTRDFPENRRARCGDTVRIIVTALDDRRPVVDVLWPEADYRDVYARAGLEVLEVHRPLGHPDEPYDWVSETTTAPWTLYVLERATHGT